MKIAFEQINKELEGLYPTTEIRSFSFLIIEKLTGYSRTEIIINKNTIFSDVQNQLLASFIEKLKNHEPIQYILGETEFYGQKFEVNNSVLIPRPETEELVAWIESDYEVTTAKRFLDIGTGSGCIALSIKKLFRNATVTAFDISEVALDTAIKNSEQLQLEIKFELIDILKVEKRDENWDVIVSNPPYIPYSEIDAIQTNVKCFEPHSALFVPEDDELIFYHRIAEFSRFHLSKNGKLYFEIHRDAAMRIVQLLEKLNFKNIELRKDISGNDRMIKCSL